MAHNNTQSSEFVFPMFDATYHVDDSQEEYPLQQDVYIIVVVACCVRNFTILINLLTVIMPPKYWVISLILPAYWSLMSNKQAQIIGKMKEMQTKIFS